MKGGWQLVTQRIPADTIPARPQYDGGIDLVLTPAEQSKAAVYYCQLRDKRLRQNEADEAAALRSLARREAA